MTAERDSSAQSADQQLAEQLAVEAGEVLLRVRAESGLTGRALGDRGDRTADDYLLARLAELRPEDAVLSEESEDSDARLAAERVWIVDPVDGTREFASPPRRDWAVHVALWERGGDSSRAQLTAAAVSLPAVGIVVGTAGARTFAGKPVSLEAAAGDGSALMSPRTGSRPRVVASGSRPPEFLDSVVNKLGGEHVAVGSAGAKAMCVVRGEADAYVHAGGQYQWDSAAPVGVALAHGLAACRIDGAPLEYNAADAYLPDLIVCRQELRDRLVEAIAEAAAN